MHKYVGRCLCESRGEGLACVDLNIEKYVDNTSLRSPWNMIHLITNKSKSLVSKSPMNIAVYFETWTPRSNEGKKLQQFWKCVNACTKPLDTSNAYTTPLDTFERWPSRSKSMHQTIGILLTLETSKRWKCLNAFTKLLEISQRRKCPSACTKLLDMSKRWKCLSACTKLLEMPEPVHQTY